MTSRTAGLNGVDLAAVRSVTQRFRDDPQAGHQAFAASVRWLGGYRTEAHLGDVTLVRGDEPVELAGEGSGPAPEDMLLGAVAQCLIVGIAGSASARGIEIESLEVRAEGVVNLNVAYGLEQGSPGFERVDIDVELQSGTSRDELEDLVQHALALAPIPSTVQRAVPVQARLV